MIEGIDLICGRTSEDAPLSMDAHSGVTIFVGPNNCGKSALLEAIYISLAERISQNNPPKASALQQVRLTPFNRSILEEHPSFRGRTDGEIIQIPDGEQDLRNWVDAFQHDWENSGCAFRRHFCIWMNGAQRLSMLPDESNASLQNPKKPLAQLLMDDKRRASFQEAVFTGIGNFPVVDSMTSYGTLKLAFSTEKPDPTVERSLDGRLSKFLKNSISASNASDGFNAYVGMLGALYASEYKAILIDEPEAFLHPALARTLGKQIAEQAKEKHVYIATHSSEFLMGAIEAGVPVKIVRLQFQNDIATASQLESSKLKTFMYDPLLRSANVLSGLFSRSVIVAEADTDRAFYQEINTRLLAIKDGRGVDNDLFLNAQNKQTVPRIVGLLRNMGVPAAGIVDLDVVADGGQNWANQVDALGVPAAMRRGLESSRVSTFDSLKEASGDCYNKLYKRDRGIELLSGGNRESAEAFIDNMAQYGLFVVPIGEVEGWLSQLNISRKKHAWLRQIFEKMGTDPKNADYVQPAQDDVWDFIGRCNSWLADPKRKGMVFG